MANMSRSLEKVTSREEEIAASPLGTQIVLEHPMRQKSRHLAGGVNNARSEELMRTEKPNRVGADDTLRAISSDFEALAAVFDEAIKRFTANGGGAEIEHLQRAKLAAERGAALAKRTCSTS